MASYIERSIGSRSSTSPAPGGVVIVYDATKDRSIREFKDIITCVLMREDLVIQEAETITVLGVLYKVLHPMGFHIQIGNDSFFGAHERAIKEDVSRKVDAKVGMLKHSAEECERKAVDIKVKIVVGAPMKNVVVQEIVESNTTWAIFDRKLRKELMFYLEHIPCKVAQIRDNLSLEVLRPYHIDKRRIDATNHKLLYSLSKPVPLPFAQDDESDNQSLISLSLSSQRSSDIPERSMMPLSSLHSKKHNVLLQDEFGSNPQQALSANQKELENKCDGSHEVMQKEEIQQKVPVLCTPIKMKTGQDSVRYSFSEMQIAPDEVSPDSSLGKGTGSKVENEHDGSRLVLKTQQTHPDIPVLVPADVKKRGLYLSGWNYSDILTATENFASGNLLGESGDGVYKGELKNGKLIAVKVQKEANTQGVAEFRSEVYGRSFARHKNIVTLLGYCCTENLRILIYEYVCNKSLEWHLFDNTEQVLDWNRRNAIAIGTAKGLHFLHEECRGSPIIHQDIRPSNILLTFDYVPLLGDFGLGKWKKNECDIRRRILGNLGYLAPEYAENGTCSEKTDVYALGIVLIQLISGRKVVDSTRYNHQQSIRQWALPLIQTLSLHELVDPCLEDSYNTYEIYNMARAAYSCVQTKPEMRPTTGEVLCLLEGTNDHLRHVKSNLYPIILSPEASLS